MLAAIVLTVCLLAEPSTCKEVPLSGVMPEGVYTMTPFWCSTVAQTEAAKWLNDHPNYRITRYTCPRTKQDKA